jgi:hypothetical protein
MVSVLMALGAAESFLTTLLRAPTPTGRAPTVRHTPRTSVRCRHTLLPHEQQSRFLVYVRNQYQKNKSNISSPSYSLLYIFAFASYKFVEGSRISWHIIYC